MANLGELLQTLGEHLSPQDMFARNAPYVKPGATTFQTVLPQLDEMAFRQWVAQNGVPFNPDAATPQDYDMRGFWQGLQQHDPHASTAIDPNDKRLHFSDYWKTPYHETFSGESKYAGPMAPRWNALDQLIAPSGRIIFDDRKR